MSRAFALSLLAAILLVPALDADAKVLVDRKAGPCKLQQAGAFDESKLFKVSMGKALRLTTRWRLDTFFEKQIINANVTVKNPTKQPLFCQFYVAFFDKQGELIGATGQGSFGDEGIAPGQEEQFGSCLIEIPPDLAGEVASFRAVLYESDKEIGK